jgi:transposase-like protein
VSAYYLRDDGQLMIEVQPGQFVSETAAQLGLFHPNLLADIQRIKGRLQRPAGKNPLNKGRAGGVATSARLTPKRRSSPPELH